MALMDIGVKARSYTGGQVKVLTDNPYQGAHPVDRRIQHA
jgi:aspartokinase